MPGTTCQGEQEGSTTIIGLIIILKDNRSTMHRRSFPISTPSWQLLRDTEPGFSVSRGASVDGFGWHESFKCFISITSVYIKLYQMTLQIEQLVILKYIRYHSLFYSSSDFMFFLIQKCYVSLNKNLIIILTKPYADCNRKKNKHFWKKSLTSMPHHHFLYRYICL